MKKKEMIDKLNELANLVEDAIDKAKIVYTQADELDDQLRDIRKKLEELPSEVDEIDEDEPKEPRTKAGSLD